MEKEWFSRGDKLVFKRSVDTQIEFSKEANEVYSELNQELFKTLIDINLEHIEQLKMLIGDYEC